MVYGLLRRGQSLAHIMDGATYLGRAAVEGFDLYHLGKYPGAVEGDGTVVGEVYEVADLARLDAAEGVDKDPPLYRRVQIEALEGPAWIYVYARSLANCFRIDSGDWLNPL